jgi:CheY-like chemotaxis protein
VVTAPIGEGTPLGYARMCRDVTDGRRAEVALEMAEEFRPDLILMDVGMHRLDGLDATRRIRERAWAAPVTIVALTGWGQEADRERSRQAGCDGHLVKTVDLGDLEKLLAELRPRA